MTEPTLRDRLVKACEPWDLPDGASIESSVVRNAHEIADAALAVIVDSLPTPRRPHVAPRYYISYDEGWNDALDAVEGMLTDE